MTTKEPQIERRKKALTALELRIAVAAITLLLSISGYLFADKIDKLNNAVTQDSLEKTLLDRGLTPEKITEKIRLERAVATEKLDNTSRNVDELKQDFKDFQKDQGEKFKEFQNAQMEMMKLLIKVNAKLEQQEGDR